MMKSAVTTLFCLLHLSLASAWSEEKKDNPKDAKPAKEAKAKKGEAIAAAKPSLDYYYFDG